MKAVWAWLGRMIYYTMGTVGMPLFINGSRRVRVGIIDTNTNKILLAKTWVSSQKWNVVGGGIMKNEDKFVAAVREVKEETGLDISTDELNYVGQITDKGYMASFTSHIFTIHVSEQDVRRAPIEIVDIGWFSLNKLPKPYNIETIKALDIKLK